MGALRSSDPASVRALQRPSSRPPIRGGATYCADHSPSRLTAPLLPPTYPRRGDLLRGPLTFAPYSAPPPAHLSAEGRLIARTTHLRALQRPSSRPPIRGGATYCADHSPSRLTAPLLPPTYPRRGDLLRGPLTSAPYSTPLPPTYPRGATYCAACLALAGG